jgi:tetratricopeptide (TPR) repeat protein
MVEEIAVTKLLADKTNITILHLLRTQPLHCRKLSTMLQKGESQIARRLSQLERAGILKSEWVHKGRNIKVYFLKIDQIRIQITNEGIEITYTPEKKQQFFPLESIFQFDIPEIELFIDRQDQLLLLDKSFFVALTGIAGIGKTSLASFYAVKLKKEGKKIFWHTFSELDSLLFVVKKLAIFLSTYGYTQLLDYLKADGTEMRVIEALLKDHMDSPNFAFFFDDYHLVTDESINSLFSELKKSEAHICVISRYKPPFISVFDSISEIRLEEMEPEAVKTLLERKGLTLKGDMLKKVSERIGGHPLALELLCQAAAGGDPVSIMEEVPPFEVGAFLWDEICSRLDPEEQHLLVSLSVFQNPVNIDGVQAVYPHPNARTVIRQLTRKNLLKRVDNGYVHHAVTRMFCLRLAQNPDALHEKAAEFCLSQETPQGMMEALYHFLEAGVNGKVAEVILDQYELLINEGYGEKLFSFCQNVDTIPMYRGQLSDVKGELYLLKGEYDAAVQCFKAAMAESTRPAKASLYRKLGEVYKRKREYKTAKALLLEGLEGLESDAAERGNILVELASVHAALSEPAEALSCCQEALALFSASGHKKGIAHVYDLMGSIYRFSDTERALELLFSCLEISQEIGDMLKVASTYVTIGNVLYERGQTDEAVTYFEKSLEISEKIGNIVGIARCSNNIGVKYALEWKWPRAIECYLRTLSICKKIKDKKGIAFSYSNLGRVYSYLGMWEKALEYFFASLQLREELSDKREMSFVHYNIGLTYQKMGDLKKALAWIEKSLQVRERINYTLGVAYCWASMGEVYGEMGECSKALAFLEKALEIHEKEKGSWMAANTRVFAAQVFVTKKEYEKALHLIDEALEPLKAAGNFELLAQAHQVAAEAHLGLGDIDCATVHARESLDNALKIGSALFEGKARRVRGAIFCHTGEHLRAEEELRLSMRVLKKHALELAKTYTTFALLCRKTGHTQKSDMLLRKAMVIFRDGGAKTQERYCRNLCG